MNSEFSLAFSWRLLAVLTGVVSVLVAFLWRLLALLTGVVCFSLRFLDHLRQALAGAAEVRAAVAAGGAAGAAEGAAVIGRGCAAAVAAGAGAAVCVDRAARVLGRAGHAALEGSARRGRAAHQPVRHALHEERAGNALIRQLARTGPVLPRISGQRFDDSTLLEFGVTFSNHQGAALASGR